MSYPAGWDLVNVTGTYIARDGVPCSGSVTFSSPQMVLRSGTVVPAADIVFTLDGSGAFSGQVPATDDPNSAPIGWLYTVTENVPGGRSGFQIAAPHTSPGIDLSTVVPVYLPQPPSSMYQLATLAQLAATTAPTGASLIGYINPISGATGGMLQDVLQRIISVMDFGAKGDGTTDDTAAIQAAINACDIGKLLLYFPARTYRVSAALTIGSGIAGIFAGGATISSLVAPGDAFQFGAFNYAAAYFIMPNVINFTAGYAFNFIGSTFVNMTVMNVQGCKGMSKFTCTAANNQVLDIVIRFNIAAQMSEAVCNYIAYNASSVMQGNVIEGSFANGCGAWVTMSGATSASLNDNVHRVAALDGGGVSGSYAINCNGATIGANIYEVNGFFGGFEAPIWIQKLGNGNSLRLNQIASLAWGNIDISGIGNLIYTGSSSGYKGSEIAASTTANNRAGFNGGAPPVSQSIELSFAIPNMTANQVVSYWVYSPFTNGFSGAFSFEPHFAVKLVPIAIVDESFSTGPDGNTAPNQILLSFVALSAISATTQTGTLTRAA